MVRVLQATGASWIEKSGPVAEIARETAVLRWCTERLPVARILEEGVGFFCMTELPGVSLNEGPVELASSTLVEALRRIHAVPFVECPFAAGWEVRLREAETRVQAGLVDESDFDGENDGRSALDILKELQRLPPPPKLRCFTHGDATLENFLVHDGRLSGIVDLGRAGIAHPAQDWALALRSVRDEFGIEGEQIFRQQLPVDCADEALLRRFCLLDELF